MIDERQLSIDVIDGLAPSAEEIDSIERLRATGMFAGEVHPVADMFPMMSDEELDALAADIRANGQRYPCIVDAAGLLVDGRNRLMACQRVEVEPRFERLPEGVDAVSFILSANAARRQMTRAQLTMLAVKIAADENSDSEFSRGWMESLIRQVPMARSPVVKAATIYRYAPEVVDRVIEGTRPFESALNEAEARRDATKDEATKIATLRKKHPDLAEKVQQGEWPLDAALSAGLKRDSERAQEKREHFEKVGRVTRRFHDILTNLDPASGDPQSWAEEWLLADPVLIEGGGDFSAARIARAADVLARCAEIQRSKE